MAGLLPLHAQNRTRYVPRYSPIQEATETAQTVKTVSGKADYSEAFQKLIDLGFPDAKGAQYINLKFAKADQRSQSDYYQRYTVKRDGNAWLLPTADPKASARTIIHQGFKLTKVALKKKRNLISRLVAGSDDKTRDGVRKAEWTEVDASKEVDEIIKQFENNENLSPLFDANSWSYDSSSMSALGDLLMTACHLHRSGQIEAGNKLAHYILTKAPYPFKVIDHIVGTLATTAYRELLDDLYAEKDWDLFLTGIRGLSKKYPRGWDSQPGFKILIPEVASHLRLGSAQLAPFRGNPLDPEIKKSLVQLLTPPEAGTPIQANSPACWLINPNGEIRNDYGESGPAPDWVSAIVTRGMDAFPTLIAASSDTTLIPAPFYAATSNHGSYSSPFQTGEDPDQSAYDSMPRPCTRGEIVRAILLKTLPQRQGDWHYLSPEQFQLTAYHWWSQNKDKSKGELGLIFLEEGDSQQKTIALQALLQSDDESVFPIVEEFILSADSLTQNIELTKKYLQKRKSKGKKFHDTFIKRLREEIDSNFGDQGGSSQYEEYFKQVTSSLSVLVNDIPPEKIMAQISSGKTTVKEGLPLLQVAIGEGSYLEQLGPLLTFITNLPEPADRLTALEKLRAWTYDDEAEFSGEDEPNDYQKDLRQLATTHLETWKTFLVRKDTLTIDAKVSARFGSPTSEAHYAAMVMNGIHYPETLYPLQDVNTISSSAEAWDLLLHRMEEFATSGQAPAFPDAQNVSGERQQAILTKVKALPTLEIIPYRKSLNLSERLAMVELLALFEEVPDNISALSNICQQIDWTRATYLQQTTRDKIENIVIGQEVSAQTVESLYTLLAKERGGIMLYFQNREGSLDGPNIIGWTTEMANGWLENFIGEDLGKLNKDKATRLEALVTFGIDQESRNPHTAVRFLEPIDQAKEKAAFDDLLKKSLSLFAPSDEEGTNQGQAGFIIATESFENQNQSSDEEDE